MFLLHFLSLQAFKLEAPCCTWLEQFLACVCGHSMCNWFVQHVNSRMHFLHFEFPILIGWVPIRIEFCLSFIASFQMKKRCKTDAHSDQLFLRRDPNWLVIGSLSWYQSWVLQPCWEEEHVGRLTYSTICHSHFWGVQSSLVLAWSRTWTEPWLELRCTQCWSMLDLYYVHQVPSKSMRPWFCATLAKESTETMVLRLQWELTRQQGQLVWNFGILCLVLLYRV